MHKYAVAALVSLFAASIAFAQAPAAPAAKPEAKPAAAAPAAAPAAKPAEAAPASGCEAKAAEKKLAGAAKSSFMKKCEKDAAAAAPAAKPEAKADGRKAQQEKMKTCNKEAKEKGLKGAERKAFMSSCLKG